MSRDRRADRRPRLRRDRGAVLPFVALTLPVLLLMTAFAVDLGRQRSSRRTMQARADVIALDLVRLADGRTEAEIMPEAHHEMIASATRNKVDPAKIEFEYGTWSVDSGFIGTLDDAVPNAVKVTASESIDYFFQPGEGSTSRSAIATYGEPVASFSVGSFGANLSPTQAGLLNSLLTPLLGHPAGVSALSYQGLAGADVNIGELAAELGLLDAHSALTTEVGASQFLIAAADVLQRNGQTAQANILRGFLTPEVDALGPISIGDLVSAATGTESSALAGDVDVLNILKTAVFGSQCTSETDLSSCSAINVPVLTTSLPLLSSSGNVRVIQGKVFHTGRVGTGTTTNQTEVNLKAKLGAQEVGTCKPTLANLLCIVDGLLVGTVNATVELDVTLKLADTSATIAAIECGNPEGLDISTHTGLYSATGTVKIDFGTGGLLGLLSRVLGSLTLTLNTSQPDVFDLAEFTVPPDVLGVTTEETGSGNIGLSGLNLQNTGGTGVLGLLGNLGITNTVGPLLSLLVNPLLQQLDQNVLGPLTDLLGLNVSGADLTPEDIGCEGQGLMLVG